MNAKQAWETYVDEPVELFISLYRVDGVTDITEMCREFASNVPLYTKKLYSVEQLDTLACLFQEHINNVGYDESKLYSKDDLKKMWDEEVGAILKLTGGKDDNASGR